jgi:hypothetical protein
MPNTNARRSSSIKTAHQKGTELEQAIVAIERAILSANPNLSEKSYKISFRRIIVVDGVKHEIDIWVDFELGNGYSSTFIFEAKNWNKTIGKDHIIVFSEKILAANAQSGFFVAKSFSRYALAAAKKDQRIRILQVTDDFPNSSVVDNFHSVYKDQSKSVADFNLIIKPSDNREIPKSMQMANASMTLNGVGIDYVAYSNGLISRVIEEHSSTVQSHTLADDTYTFETARDIILAPDVLLINGVAVERIKLTLTYQFQVVRPKIVSKFDIESRGRAHILEPVSMGSYGTSQVTIIERAVGDGTHNARPEFVVKVVPPV